MAKEILTFRIQKTLLERADNVVQRLRADPDVKIPANDEISRSSVLRMAVTLGLEALEEKYKPKRKKK